jgi:hypothetical protein
MIKRIASNLLALFDLQLQEWFPPVLDVRLDATSRQYHDRITRKGVFRPLGEIAGVTIVRVIKGQGAPPAPASGTRAARQAVLI